MRQMNYGDFLDLYNNQREFGKNIGVILMSKPQWGCLLNLWCRDHGLSCLEYERRKSGPIDGDMLFGCRIELTEKC